MLHALTVQTKVVGLRVFGRASGQNGNFREGGRQRYHNFKWTGVHKEEKGRLLMRSRRRSRFDFRFKAMAATKRGRFLVERRK